MLPLVATPFPDLPDRVADALALPGPAETSSAEAAGITFFIRSWGEASSTPLLLLHGVTSSSLGWWRVGPALASAGFRVTAPDMPAHGSTGPWQGHWQLRENARDLVALVDALRLSRDVLRVVAHSWGAATAAAFPAAGLRPARLVLIDPPALPLQYMELMTRDPIEHRYESFDEALLAMGTAN